MFSAQLRKRPLVALIYSMKRQRGQETRIGREDKYNITSPFRPRSLIVQVIVLYTHTNTYRRARKTRFHSIPCIKRNEHWQDRRVLEKRVASVLQRVTGEMANSGYLCRAKSKVSRIFRVYTYMHTSIHRVASIRDQKRPTDQKINPPLHLPMDYRDFAPMLFRGLERNIENRG